jgi:hypothetical protein
MSERQLGDLDGFQLAGMFEDDGGIAAGDELVDLMRQYWPEPTSTVARWIVRREVVAFPWGDHMILPLFQFDLPQVTLRPEVAAVVEELSGAFDEWEMAAWFSLPNCLLGEEAPARRIKRDPGGVLAVARVDRFIVKG